MGNVFVTIDKVALNAGVNAAPYLYQLPQDLQVYSALLVLFQVKSKFSNRDYVEALLQMAVETGAVGNNASNTSTNTATNSSASTNTLLLVTLLETPPCAR